MVPLPVRVTTLTLPVVELLVKVSEPDAAPAVAGLNRTWIVMATVGFRVTGKVAPENENPAPVMDAPLTITGELPVELRVTGKVRGVPTGSSPKLRLVVLKVRTGFATPVPLRATEVVVPLEELLEMEIAPLAAPVTVGSKLTCKVTD